VHPLRPSALSSVFHAKKEGITGVLYPLFVHNIGALLNQPANDTPISSGAIAEATTKVKL